MWGNGESRRFYFQGARLKNCEYREYRETPAGIFVLRSRCSHVPISVTRLAHSTRLNKVISRSRYDFFMIKVKINCCYHGNVIHATLQYCYAHKRAHWKMNSSHNASSTSFFLQFVSGEENNDLAIHCNASSKRNVFKGPVCRIWFDLIFLYKLHIYTAHKLIN